MRNKNIAVMLVGAVVTACSLSPSAALGQASSQPSAVIHTGLPRNNIRGSQIAAGRPGLWTQSSIATHNKRQSAALDNFGGVTISQTQADKKPSIRDAVLAELVKIFQASIAAATAAINAAITTGT